MSIRRRLHLILSYLEAEQAGMILSSLPQEMQADIAKRIATMDSTSPEVISEIEAVLERKLSSTVTQDFTETGGVDAVVEVLMVLTDRQRRQFSMRLKFKIQNWQKKFASECSYLKILLHWITVRFSELFVIVKMKILILSLKVSSEEVKEVLFRNMSQRMAESFQEEMEIMGPVRLRDVEEAQSRIVGIIRRLEDSGEIIIARGGGDDIIV